jgi:hypothetical protein
MTDEIPPQGFHNIDAEVAEMMDELTPETIARIAEGMNGPIGTIGLAPVTRTVGTGERQQIMADDPGGFANPAPLDRALERARANREHLWVMTMAHAISDQSLATMAEIPPLFDRETLLYSGLGCFVCEREYQPRLRFRPCTGEPQ